jgi:hypothetical protein
MEVEDGNEEESGEKGGEEGTGEEKGREEEVTSVLVER